MKANDSSLPDGQELTPKGAGPITIPDKNEIPQDQEKKEVGHNTRIEQAETRAEQAEARTEEAKTRTEQAEVRTEQAETRTEQAKTRTEQAEIRTEQAETRSEQAIRDSELSYRRLFEAAKDGILILDADTGQISDVNPSLMQILDFSHEELVGTLLWELGPFRDIVSNKAKFDQIHQQGYVLFENLPLETKAGRKIVVEFVSIVYQVGEGNVIQCNVRDITERKKTEQSLTLLNACVSNLNDIVLITDANPIDEPGPRIVFANEALERFTGYTQAETLGRNPRFLQGPNTDRRVLQEIRDALVQQKQIRRQLINYKKDGTEYWMDTDIVPILDAGGECTHFVAIARDISEVKKNEESLNLFRTLMDRSPDAIEVVDPETGRFIDVNETACQRLGYTRDEMLSLSIPDVIVAGDSPFSMQLNVEEIRRTGFKIIEGRHRRKDGSTFPSEVNVQYIDLNRGYLVAVVRDITERKRTEARFRRLVDSNAQGVIFWNTKGEITGANDSFLHTVRYTREDLEAGRINWLAMTPLEYAQLDRRALEEIAATGASALYEKELICKDGTRVPVLLGAASFEDNPEEGVCFFLDLTERKKLEHQFLRAQRMESIGTLAGGIAHDLNNILAPIMMSIDILKTMSDKPEAKNILETIQISARRGADIVRQVLSFARGIEGERIEVQPRHLLQDLESIIKDTFPKDIKLQFSVPNDIWTILGDPTQIHQILVNLCVNARDALPDGGSLSINVENCVLDEHYAMMNIQASLGHYICISVIDTGIGMTPDLIDKIFEPFFTTKELNKGTGLGLSTVMAIVKSHSGIINVYSEPGKGTTFKVYLPALDATSEARKEETQQVNLPRGNGETILVVDDEASILTITSQTLQAFGYRVLTATDGTEALAVYVENKKEVAVVLTDMAMPILDGPATIRALMKINPAVKIIGASGLHANGSLAKASGAGVKHFLTKPYTAGTLLRVIRTILDES